VSTAASSLAVSLREASVGAVISPENVVPGDVSIAIDNSRMPGDRKRLVKPASPCNPGIVITLVMFLPIASRR